MIIYKMISPTNKVYIGQTWNLYDRLKNYRNYNCKNQSKLYNSLLKYGFEKHNFEILINFYFDKNEITKQIVTNTEQYYMNYYREIGFKLLNIREAGSNGTFKHTKEAKLKISISSKNKTHTIETKEKISLSNKGKK